MRYDEHLNQAQHVTRRVWPLVLPMLHSDSNRLKLIKERLRPSWIETLELPLGKDRPEAQTVALVNGHDFHRELAGESIEHEYQTQHRTLVSESIGVRSDGWFSLATLRFTQLARCQIFCSMYESHHGDATMIPHVDAWHGVIMQMRGSKVWQIGQGKDTQFITTYPGDVLLMPPDVLHTVSTPEYSVHLVFAFLTEKPIRAQDHSNLLVRT